MELVEDFDLVKIGSAVGVDGWNERIRAGIRLVILVSGVKCLPLLSCLAIEMSYYCY